MSQASSTAARHALITQRLRQRRDELGLTQKQIVTRLAQCGLQTTNRALSSLEHGSGLDVAKLPELAVALNCTVTYLLGLTDDPRSWQPTDQPVPAASRVAAPIGTSARPLPVAPSRSDGPAGGTPGSPILGSYFPDHPAARTRSPGDTPNTFSASRA